MKKRFFLRRSFWSNVAAGLLVALALGGATMMMGQVTPPESKVEKPKIEKPSSKQKTLPIGECKNAIANQLAPSDEASIIKLQWSLNKALPEGIGAGAVDGQRGQYTKKAETRFARLNGLPEVDSSADSPYFRLKLASELIRKQALENMFDQITSCKNLIDNDYRG